MEKDNKAWFTQTQLSPSDVNTQDENISELQNEINIEIHNIKKELNDEYLDAEMDVETTPKFSVKVEVEEVNDKNEVFFSVIDNVPSADLPDKYKDLAAKSSSDTVSFAKFDNLKLLLFDGNEEEIYKEADRIASTSQNVADKILAIEVRNTCGILAKSEKVTPFYENLFRVIEEWRQWCTDKKCDDEPLFYKCYLCEQSWWHLGPFVEHAKGHSSEVYILYLELKRPYECCIVLGTNEYEEERCIYTEGDCWRCNRPFSFHDSTILQLPFYKCKGCKVSFYKCRLLTQHENKCKALKHDRYACKICPNNYEFQGDMTKHLHITHRVRSDLVVYFKDYNCIFCNEQYTNMYHQCVKMCNKFQCNKCNRSFTSKMILASHKLHTRESTFCKVCNVPILFRCNLISHYLTHTDNFKLLNKCLKCTDYIFLFTEEYGMTIHQWLWHKGYDAKKLHFDMILLPKNIYENLKRINPELTPLVTPSHINLVQAEMATHTNEEKPDEEKPLCVIKDGPISINERESILLTSRIVPLTMAEKKRLQNASKKVLQSTNANGNKRCSANQTETIRAVKDMPTLPNESATKDLSTFIINAEPVDNNVAATVVNKDRVIHLSKDNAISIHKDKLITLAKNKPIIYLKQVYQVV